jgi:two-component system phosphate regulon response regulator PhoB
MTPRRRVLVVDDEPHIGVVLRLQLEARGYEFSLARTLGEARALLADVASPPDVLLLDLHLPDGSGLDLLAELRRSPATRQLPVLVLTGDGDETVLVTSGALGADVLTKPFSPSKLTARLGEMLGEIVDEGRG